MYCRGCPAEDLAVFPRLSVPGYIAPLGRLRCPVRAHSFTFGPQSVVTRPSRGEAVLITTLPSMGRFVHTHIAGRGVKAASWPRRIWERGLFFSR